MENIEDDYGDDDDDDDDNGGRAPKFGSQPF